nr:helix-turn-helix domain-containing protein [Octadecabacter arcticus]
MDIRSKHLSSEDRGVILAEHNRGSSQRLICQLLHRPASTICRELARGRQEDGSYCPQAARQAYDARRARCRNVSTTLRQWLLDFRLGFLRLVLVG